MNIVQILTHENKDLREIAKYLVELNYSFDYSKRFNCWDRKHFFQTEFNGNPFSICLKENVFFTFLTKSSKTYHWVSIRYYISEENEVRKRTFRYYDIVECMIAAKEILNEK